MPTNDQAVLDQVLATEASERGGGLSDSQFFEIFVAEQSLKDRDLSYEEIELGLVDGGRDGAVDAIYLFLDDELAPEDTDFRNMRKGVALEIVLIQAKREPSFREAPIDQLAPTLSDLLPLSVSPNDYADKYRKPVRDGFGLFRRAVRETANRAASIHFRIIYACRGDAPSDGVRGRVAFVEKVVKDEYPSAGFGFDFFSATELLQHYRRLPQTIYELPIVEAIAPATPGMVCLVGLTDFVNLISDSEHVLRTPMFDANVRDYQGDVEVNQAIAHTLRNPTPEDFWWLNNGVTILADNTTQSSKTLSIENPSIVNGLQTSYEIHRYFREEEPESDDRHVLVRIINVTDDETRDRIIRATNSQTGIQPASLRATDSLHRSIEDLLKGYGLYYERRKNFYKNRGRPRSQIIGIGYLAQAVMAAVLFESNTSRARPGTLLKRDPDYERVFSNSHPIELYRVAAQLMLKVDHYLAATKLSRYERTNFRFHMAAVAGATAVRSTHPNPGAFAKLDVAGWDEEFLAECLEVVQKTFATLQKDDRALDEIAKSSEIVPALKSAVNERLS